MREVLDPVDEIVCVVREAGACHCLVDALCGVHDAVDALLRCQLQDGCECILGAIKVS